MSSSKIDPDRCRIDYETTPLEGEDAGQIKLTVIVRQDAETLVESEGQIIIDGDDDDDSWAEMRDAVLAEERSEAEGLFLALLGFDEESDEAVNALNLAGGGDLPSPA